MNQVLVFNSNNNTQIATLRTGNTPKGMAITFDQRYLLVGCDNSHYLNVFDLETLQAVSAGPDVQRRLCSVRGSVLECDPGRYA